MKQAKTLRTLEELWDLEDSHPLVEPSAGGLLRWMVATGMLTEKPFVHHAPSRRNAAASRRSRNGRS